MGEVALAYHSAADLGEAYRRRELSPVEVVTAVLERIDALDGILRAFAWVDREGALAEARAAEGRHARGEPLGPLDGIPVSVKDLLFVRGMPTAAGSPALTGFVADDEEIAVSRLRAGGAVILGKTAVPELGFGPGTQSPLLGVSRNPWDVARTPGGSSGGAAAAVAAGMGPLALGTDAGGSIRAPAAFCGVVGLKPSFGRVAMHPAARDDRYPVFSGFETFDAIGPIARTVSDAAIALDVIAGQDARDRHSVSRDPDGFDIAVPPAGGGLRIGWTVDVGGGMPVEPAIVEAVARAAELLGGHLGSLVPVDLDLGDTRPIFAPLAALEMGALREWAEAHPDEANERVRRLVGESWTFEDASAAFAARKVLAESVARVFEAVDVLVTPTTPVTAYPVDVELPALPDGRPMARAYDLSVFTAPFTLSGSPAISVPCGWVAEGLPIGMQLVVAQGMDRLVLGAAAAFEALAPWAHRTPVPTS